MSNGDQDPSRESLIDGMRRFLGRAGDTGMTSMAWLSPEGKVPIRQTELAPDGLEFCEDVSPGRWVEEGLSGFARGQLPAAPGVSRLRPGVSSGLPGRLRRAAGPVVSTVASWTGRTVHPLMQFNRIAGMGDDARDMYPDPPWGEHPQYGSIPEAELRTLVDILYGFTTTPHRCFFGLWEGRGYIDNRLYPPVARVKGVVGTTCCSRGRWKG